MSSEFTDAGVGGNGFLSQEDLTSRTDNASNPDLIMANYQAMKAMESAAPVVEVETSSVEIALDKQILEVGNEATSVIGENLGEGIKADLGYMKEKSLKLKVLVFMSDAIAKVESQIGENIASKVARKELDRQLNEIRMQNRRIEETNRRLYEDQSYQPKDLLQKTVIPNQVVGELNTVLSQGAKFSTHDNGSTVRLNLPETQTPIYDEQGNQKASFEDETYRRITKANSYIGEKVRENPIISTLETLRGGLLRKIKDNRALQEMVTSYNPRPVSPMNGIAIPTTA